MMKSLIFAAALVAGSAALAQTPAPAPTGQVQQPSNANPARDARGIPVISNPAEVPAGANQSPPVQPGAVFQPNPNQQAVFAPRPSTGNYPPCTRTVTDNCVQTHERGRSPNG